jgi:hypothetical protein
MTLSGNERKFSVYATLSFVSFICIFALDGAKSVLSEFLPFPPFGFFGLLISLILLVPFFSIERKRSLNLWILCYLAFNSTIILLALCSSFFEWVDLWLFIKLFVSAPLIGYFVLLYITITSFDKRKLQFLLGLFLLLTISVFIFYFNRSLFLDLNYLNLSEGILIMSILLMVLLKESWQQFTLITLTVLLLFMSDSRFVFFSYIILILIYFALKSLKSFIALLSIGFILLVAVFIYNPDIILESRLARLVLNTNKDTSLNARTELLEAGHFSSNFYSLVGKHAYYRSDCNGCYAHNIMSLWFEYGITGALYAVMLILFIVNGWVNSLIRMLKSVHYANFYTFFFLISIHATLGFTVSKHWQYFTMFMVFGMALFILDKQALPKKSQINL